MRILFAMLIAALPGLAAAQTTPLEELRARIADRSAAIGGYRALLEDPEPDNALAALQVMLESDDPALRRMALEFGVLSSDPAIRQTTLAAFFAGRPSIALAIDGTATTDEDFADLQYIMSKIGGTIGGDKIGSLSFRVGEWSEKLGCHVDHSKPDQCLARLTPTSVSLLVNGLWTDMTLGDEGALTGGATYKFNKSHPVKLTLRLTE